MPTAVDLAEYLARQDLAVPVPSFPIDRSVIARPGLYSWWVDDEGRGVLEDGLGAPLESLIYAGQAGATSTRSAKPSTATLGSRILNNHLRGTAYGSTFRKSLSAVLLQPLGLVIDKPYHLTKVDNERVSQWMRNHLSIVVCPFDDRDILRAIEDEVVRILDPPLNLDGMPRDTTRQRLSQLRRQLSQPSAIKVASDGPGASPEVAEALDATEAPEPSEVRFMVPTGGPDDWRRLLADPDLHWVVGRSARTLAHAWEDVDGWPPEIAIALARVPALAGLRPVYGFPEFKTPLPGGRRSSQTDLMVIATDGKRRATVAIERKVDETFGDYVVDWLGADPSPGKLHRLGYLADLLGVSTDDLSHIRYQLVHRSAAAKIEGARNGSEVGIMLVHSWAANLEGFDDFAQFAGLLGAKAEPGTVVFSESADLWLGWVTGDSRYLAY